MTEVRMHDVIRGGARIRALGVAATVGAGMLCFAASAAATDLRGRVEGQSQYSSIPTPVNGTWVELTDARGQQVLARYYTGPDGMYYFRNIAPGNYQIRTGGRAYPLMVQPRPAQDIGPIQLRF
jgi:hypothetical protein